MSPEKARDRAYVLVTVLCLAGWVVLLCAGPAPALVPIGAAVAVWRRADRVFSRRCPARALVYPNNVIVYKELGMRYETEASALGAGQ